VRKHADVARAVADHGEGLFVYGGEDELSLFSVRQHFAGVGVDYLGDELVFADMHAVLFAAFVADARSLKLCEAVDVVGLDAELRLDVAAHLLAPGLGSEDPCLEFNCVLEPLFYDRLAEVGGVGGSTAEDRRAEVLHELYLAVGRAG